MKNVQKIDLGLTGYDELFMNDAERKENKLPRIYDVPISEIDDTATTECRILMKPVRPVSAITSSSTDTT